MAKIELRTRNIDSDLPGIDQETYPQHSYFIITYDNGVQNIIRAGASDNDPFFGDLQVMKGLYNDQLCGPAKSDYITDASKYRSATIFEGSEFEVRGYVTKLWQYGVKINMHDFDYKMPGWDITNNCNNFIYKALEYAGLPFVHPTYPDGTKVNMPGLLGKMGHTTLDKLLMDRDTRNNIELLAQLEKFNAQELVRIKAHDDTMHNINLGLAMQAQQNQINDFQARMNEIAQKTNERYDNFLKPIEPSKSTGQEMERYATQYQKTIWIEPMHINSYREAGYYNNGINGGVKHDSGSQQMSGCVSVRFHTDPLYNDYSSYGCH